MPELYSIIQIEKKILTGRIFPCMSKTKSIKNILFLLTLLTVEVIFIAIAGLKYLK